MERLAISIELALEQSDWEEIAVVEQMLRTELPAMAAQRAWTPAERHALARLRRAHETARGRCAVEMTLLRKQMNEISMLKDGLLAYAQSSESQER